MSHFENSAKFSSVLNGLAYKLVFIIIKSFLQAI